MDTPGSMPSGHVPPTPPPDRSHVATEHRNTRSMSLHLCGIAECVRLINEEDRHVSVAVGRASSSITAFIEAAAPGFLAGGRLIYLGAGTSGRLGVLDASECPPTFCVPPGRVIGIIAGGDSALRRSSEGKEDDPRGAITELHALALTSNDSVLGIAAGGTTPYVLGGLEWVAYRRRESRGHSPSVGVGPIVGLLTCAPMNRPEFVDHHIVLDTGTEVVTGSTRMKAGSATKMALNIISTTLMVQYGKVYQNLMVDVRATNDKLRDRAARIITTLTGLPRHEAFTLLDRANGYVKVAVVMHERRVEVHEAQRLLDEAGGRLDRVVPN